jgi:hypothetical protein
MRNSPHLPVVRSGLVVVSLVLSGLVLPPALQGQSGEVPPEWRTVAERTDFRATGSYRETLDFLERLAARAPEIHLTTFGTSSQGRALPLVIVSKERAFTPEAAAKLAEERGKPILLIQNGIHAGEIDGKDACLRILRDLALGGHRDLLEAATVLVIPILNVDGHERVSPYNRANQNGPVDGMGWRTNAQGLDLNRDHLKLVSPEIRAVLDLFNRWRPHLHVDDHVTDGADHGWVLTWAWAEAPQAPAAVGRWLERHMPPVLAATEAAGHPLGPYVSLVDRQDPSKGFNSRVANPWYATGYYPLRNRPSVLVEMHAPKPYGDRVRANQEFLVQLWRRMKTAGRELIAVVHEAEAQTVAEGRKDAPPSALVLTWADDPEPDRIAFPVDPWELEPSVVSGEKVLVFSAPAGKPKPLEVPWIHGSVPGLTVTRPRGYLVLPGWPQIEARLAGHDLRVKRLTRPVELGVETVRVAEPQLAPTTYQGQVRVTASVSRSSERVEVPAGALWIPADQPGFEVAAQLLEPEAPSSLFSWGLLSSVLERKEYIEPRNLERWVREALEDPEVKEAWRKALADEKLAGDPRARYMWWFRRTPWWDDTVGLLPFLRVMEPPELVTEPWSGPGASVMESVTKPAGD